MLMKKCNFIDSEFLMSELNSQANKLKKLFSVEDAEKTKKQTKHLLQTFNTTLEYHKTKSSLNKRFVEQLFNALTIIRDFVKTKFFKKLMSTAEFSDFPEKIRGILQMLPMLSGDDEFFKNVWQKSVEIISYLLDGGNLHSWHKCIQMIFLSNPVNKEIIKTPDVMASRFSYLINYIIKSNQPVISFWWEIISSSLFSLFISYPVLSTNGEIEPKNCIEGKCPSSVFEDIVKLFKNVIGKYYNLLKKDSPNEAIAMIYLLIQNEEVNGFYSLMEWFISLWFSLANKDYRKYETFALLDIFAKNSHSIIITFMQLFARYIVKKVINDKNSSIYPLFLTFRGIWDGPISSFATPELLQNILFTIYAELTDYSPSFAIFVFLTFTFDYKLTNPIIWDFFRSRTNFDSQNVTVCSMFISVISIFFSPMFLIFSKDKVNEYFVGIRNRQERNNEEDLINVKNYMKLFNDPYGFFEFLPNWRFVEIKDSYNELIRKNIAGMLDIYQSDWEYDNAILYLFSFLTIFPKNTQFLIYSDMINAFNAILETLPIVLVNNRTFLWDRLITPLFDYLLNTKSVTLNVMNAINNTINNMGFTIVDEKNTNDWIKIITKFLFTKKRTDLKSLLYPILKSLLQFSPKSDILVPILALFINQNSIETTSVFNHSFIVSSYSICFSNGDIIIPNDFIEAFSNLKENDQKFVENALHLCDIKNRTELLKHIQKSTIKSSNGDISFYFICSIFIQELFFSEHISEWMQSSFLTSIKNINDSTTEYIQMFAFLYDLSDKIIQKFPTFMQYFVNESLTRYHDPSFLRSAFELVSSSPNLIPSFLAKLKTMNIKNFSSFFEPIPFGLYKSFILPEDSPEDIDIHITYRSKYINSIHFYEDSFDFYNKSLYSYQSFHVDQIKSNGDEKSEILLPEVHENKNEKAYDKQYDTSLSSLLQTYFEPSQKEIEITCSPKCIQEEVTEDLPVFDDFEYPVNIKENDSNMFYYQSLKCSSAINFFTTFYNISSMKRCCFKQTPRFRIKLTSLYRASPREEAKIGVLYVAPNQFDQKSILSNTEETSSEDFKNFLSSIGSYVDLSQHKGYNGKLENVTGKSVYYFNSQMEVMFHVSTLLPDNPKDPQKIDKKRHIGNDHVHIIWCENPSGYNTSVITSQFNDAHIIIFPLKTGLYRVIVQKKDQSLNFFPLPKDCILDAKSLGFLVRTTAVIANKLIVQSQEFKPHELYSKLFDSLIHET